MMACFIDEREYEDDDKRQHFECAVELLKRSDIEINKRDEVFYLYIPLFYADSNKTLYSNVIAA